MVTLNAYLYATYELFCGLGICDIATDVERDFRALCQAFASLDLLFADTIHDRETARHTVFTAELCKLNHPLKACFSELRTADGLILFITRRIERNVHEIDFIL